MSDHQDRGALSWPVIAVLLGMLLLRFFFAATAPMSNDEAYYWDWARTFQLSYLDHPPGVAWLAALGGHIASGALGARFFVPFLYLASSLFMLGAVRELKGEKLERHEVYAWLLLTQLAPVFSLEGLLILPDAGLLTALAAALWLFFRAARRSADGEQILWPLAPLAGLALGIGGLFKYHAAPLAIGMGIGLLIPALKDAKLLRQRLAFLGIAAIVATAVTTPVWLWNAQHNFASFRFQGDHGFGSLGFQPLAAVRAYLGQLVMLTPLIFLGGIMVAWRGWRSNSLALISIWAFIPLFILLQTLALGKQMLPHWIAPAFWMLIPVLALSMWPKRLATANWIYAALVGLVLPWVLCLAPLRQALVASFHGQPGPLSELTIWDPLSESLTKDPMLHVFLNPKEDAKGGCPKPMAVASLRWFWTAQLAYHLPNHPKVYTIDLNHPSHYTFRDDLGALAGCQVMIIGDERHLDEAQLKHVLVHWEKVPVKVPSHADTSVVVLLGHFRTRDDLQVLNTR